MNTYTELSMIEYCLEIGRIAESNCHYTAGLDRKIQATGRTIKALTVGELLELNRQYNKDFNAMYGVTQ